MSEQEKYIEALKSDPRSTAELIQIALDAPDSEEYARRPAISVLHMRGTREVLEAALRLCDSENPVERELGADLLGQLGYPERTFPDECAAALISLLEREEDSDVIDAACIAAGFLHDPRVIPSVIAYAGHDDSHIRYSVTYALGLSHAAAPEMAIPVLISLSEDPDNIVRNFATFGLGSQSDEDTPEIREALVRRLDEEDYEIRGEALVGLAKRRDERVVEPLLRELTRQEMPDDEDLDFAVRAAALLADRRLCEALQQLKSGPGESPEDLDKAIKSCCG